jgi:hypothetical protein
MGHQSRKVVLSLVVMRETLKNFRATIGGFQTLIFISHGYLNSFPVKPRHEIVAAKTTNQIQTRINNRLLIGDSPSPAKPHLDTQERCGSSQSCGEHISIGWKNPIAGPMHQTGPLKASLALLNSESG